MSACARSGMRGADAPRRPSADPTPMQIPAAALRQPRSDGRTRTVRRSPHARSLDPRSRPQANLIAPDSARAHDRSRPESLPLMSGSVAPRRAFVCSSTQSVFGRHGSHLSVVQRGTDPNARSPQSDSDGRELRLGAARPCSLMGDAGASVAHSGGTPSLQAPVMLVTSLDRAGRPRKTQQGIAVPRSVRRSSMTPTIPTPASPGYLSRLLWLFIGDRAR